MGEKTGEDTKIKTEDKKEVFKFETSKGYNAFQTAMIGLMAFNFGFLARPYVVSAFEAFFGEETEPKTQEIIPTETVEDIVEVHITETPVVVETPVSDAYSFMLELLETEPDETWDMNERTGYALKEKYEAQVGDNQIVLIRNSGQSMFNLKNPVFHEQDCILSMGEDIEPSHYFPENDDYTNARIFHDHHCDGTVNSANEEFGKSPLGLDDINPEYHDQIQRQYKSALRELVNSR